MDQRVRFKSVSFHEFKGFSRFHLRLDSLNLLVGPNNAGKSTIIDAFRILSAGLKRANARGPERFRDANGIERFGYTIVPSLLSATTENVHHDYLERAAVVTFTLTNSNKLRLEFPANETACLLIPDSPRRIIRSVSAFKSEFPVSIGLVPVLGPVAHFERLLNPETVREGVETRLASRHFRNWWFRADEIEFEAFRSTLSATWPGLDIARPYVADDHLVMFSAEARIPRELYWSGFGYQVWCQLITHLARARDKTIVAIDEAELYLHPDLQRRLLLMLRQLGADIVLATHSTELVAEADTNEVVLVDKMTKAARRVRKADEVGNVLRSLGSSQNIVLTRLARTRRVLMLEGDDYRLLRTLGATLHLDNLAAGQGFATTQLGGYKEPHAIRDLFAGMEHALGSSCRLAVVMDRDFRCEAEVAAIERELAFADVRHVLRKKELENYLLCPAALERSLDSALRRRGSSLMAQPFDVLANLEDLTASMRTDLQAAWVSKEVKYRKAHEAHLDESTTTKAAMRSFDNQWQDLESRLGLVSGKDFLANWNTLTRSRLNVDVAPGRLAQNLLATEIPAEMTRMLHDLERFATSLLP